MTTPSQPPELFTKVVQGLVRHVIGYAGGFFTSIGMATESVENITTGVVALIVAAGWSWFDKRNQKKEASKSE